MKVVVDIETAIGEVENWLDYHKVMPLQRKDFEGSIKILIEGVQYGILKLSDNAFTQTLLEPVGKDGNITEIKYKARIKNSIELAPFKKDAEGGAGLIEAVWSCLTADAMPKQVYKLLDKADKRFAGAIVIFFLET